jgi:hypothetical protein
MGHYSALPRCPEGPHTQCLPGDRFGGKHGRSVNTEWRRVIELYLYGRKYAFMLAQSFAIVQPHSVFSALGARRAEFKVTKFRGLQFWTCAVKMRGTSPPPRNPFPPIKGHLILMFNARHVRSRQPKRGSHSSLRTQARGIQWTVTRMLSTVQQNVQPNGLIPHGSNCVRSSHYTAPNDSD